MNDVVRIHEVSPRDGLQNEADFVATTDKVALVDLISAAGFGAIEVTSFVSPKWVPQLADATEVMQAIARRDGVIYGALTPNVRGFEDALSAGAGEVAVFVAASETFSQKNTNCSIAESLERVAAVMARAKATDMRVRGYVSCVLGCPYEGDIAPDAVRRVSKKLLDAGCYEVSLGDTIGHGTPETTRALMTTMLDAVSADQLAGHFHDTRGTAIDNVRVSLDFGLRTFDAAMAGLGGCPYAPGASGNVDTRLLVSTLTDLGMETGVDSERLEEASHFAALLKRQTGVV